MRRCGRSPAAAETRACQRRRRRGTGWTLGAGRRDRVRRSAAGTVPRSRAGFLFDVPVRFAEDRLDITGAAFAAGEAPSVPLIEMREAA